MKRSIYDLYPIAMAEEEGAGTAYEYYVKARLLRQIHKGQTPPRRILVAGLPEKYGFSMDFAVLAQDWEAEILFLDERPEKLQQFADIYDKLSQTGLLSLNRLRYQVVDDISNWKLNEEFDLLLCCEVLQRLGEKQRLAFISQASEHAKKTVIFAPNAANSSHADLSGLSTVSLAQLENLAGQTTDQLIKSGWIDLPPFPPGITRSEDQRQNATSSPLQRLLFWGINLWADAEGLVPLSIRKKQAHIVYVALQSGDRAGTA